MFCPNCGTQNPDAAQTCSKCSFHLKSAAAPKFKGTMLMMNQPGPMHAGAPLPPAPAMPPVPPGRPAPAVAPPPAGAIGHAPSKLKGTMVGVAPMAGGPPLPPPPPGTSPLPPPMAPPLPPPPPYGVAPPVAGGVNPLGGTVAADAAAFRGFPPHGGPSGTAPMAAAAPPPMAAPPPYGAPPPAYPPGFAAGPPQAMPGTPPAPFGLPAPGAPSGFAGSPPPAGLAPGAAFGGGDAPTYASAAYAPAPVAPIAPALGSAQGLAAYGASAISSALGVLSSAGVARPPTRRNPVTTLLLPLGVVFGGALLSGLLGLISPWLSAIGALVTAGGGIWSLLLAIQMIAELRTVARNDALAWWPLLVPFYNLYFMWIVVPQEVAKAKQSLAPGRPPQPIFLYILVWPFALASDLNDLAA